MTSADSAGAFDTLIYTDCKVGQGLRGEVGLQFQARSAGADAAAMSIVQRHLLYEPPAKWMGERRAVQTYPPSLAHTADGLFATAAGVYLGREVNGGREGNSLTHSIVTSDAEAYNNIRPAQLFNAPFWSVEPAPTTTCAPIPPGWQPGPFDIEPARDFVLAQPDGQHMLTALVSTLERINDEDRRRVLFIGDDPAEILHWIAAGTLLLPQEKALGIGFKVYTTNPASASQPVIAVHPDWGSTSARVGNDLGYVIFDLTASTCTDVKPTRYALAWVASFCTVDPIDVVDAIEVSAGSQLPPETAPLVGRTAIMQEEVTVDKAEILVDWLRDSDPGLLAEHRGTIVDRLTSSDRQWPQHILLSLDELSRTGQVPIDRVQPIRLALIRAELDRAARLGTASDVILPRLPRGTWREEDQFAAEREVSDALYAAPATSFDAILRLASRFKLGVNIEEINDEASRFIAYWANNPGAYPTEQWPCGAEIDHMLDASLSARIEKEPRAAATIGDQWWPTRWEKSDPLGTHLQRAVIGAAVSHLDEDPRIELVLRWIEAALDYATPAAALAATARCLWARTSPTEHELRELAKIAPRDTPFDPWLFDDLARDLRAGELTFPLLALGHNLQKRGAWQPPAGTAKLIDAHRELDAFATMVTDLAQTDPVPPQVATIRAAPPRLLALWTERLTKCLIEADHPDLVCEVLRAARPLVDPYVARLADRLVATASEADVAAAIYLAYVGMISIASEDELRQALAAWINRASSRRIKDVNRRVEILGPEWLAHWESVLAEVRGTNVAVRLKRRMVG